MAKKHPVLKIPSKSSQSNEWILWHKLLKKTFGKKKAEIIFVKAWGKRHSTSANTKQLRDYLDKYKIYLEADGFFESLEYTAGDIGDVIGNVFNVGKTLAILVVSGVVIGSIFIIYAVAKDPKGAAQTALALRQPTIKMKK